MKLSEFIKPELIWVIDKAKDRDQVLRLLADRIAEQIEPVNADGLYEALVAREQKRSTGTPEGVALPHAMLEGVDDNVVAVTLIKGGVDFLSPLCRSVDLVFILIGPPKPWEHLRALARVARVCNSPGGLERLRSAADAGDLYERLIEEDQRHV